MCFETCQVGAILGDKGYGLCLQGSCIPFRKVGRVNLGAKLAYYRCCKSRRRKPRFLLRCNRILRGVFVRWLNLFLRLRLFLHGFSPAGHELHALAPAGET